MTFIMSRSLSRAVFGYEISNWVSGCCSYVLLHKSIGKTLHDRGARSCTLGLVGAGSIAKLVIHMSAQTARTLIVADSDPEGVNAAALERAFARENLKISRVTDPRELLTRLERDDIEVLFLAVTFGREEPNLVHELARRFSDVPVVVMADEADRVELGRYVSAGASDFVRLPIDDEEAVFTLRKLRSLPERSVLEDAPPPPDSSGVISRSAKMREVFTLVDRVAAGTSTVMIRGESGTGKEVVARRIHQKSPRCNGPFVKVHCAALPEQILESELFGYERGAFTGASARKPGRVELAEGGTLFLDEIGDISAVVQVKLLRLLQDREYERLGGTHTLKADVRFLSATHRNLEKMVKMREFREDLYYRLNVVRVALPSLRDRREDIAPMARYFAAQAAAANCKTLHLDEAALPALEAASWRGNVRQLQNFIERLVVMSEHERVSREDVESELAREEGTREDENTSDLSVVELNAALRQAERRALEKALKKAAGNRVLAARLLGVSRRTLFYKLRTHGIG